MADTPINVDDRPPHEDPPYIDMVVGPDRDVDNRRFGAMLSDWREAVTLTRSAAADALGVSTEYLRLIELGRRTPALGLMRAILDLYEVNGELGRLQPGGDRPDLIVYPAHAEEPLTIDFTSRVREARRQMGFGHGDSKGMPTALRSRLTRSHAEELGRVAALLPHVDVKTLRAVHALLESAIDA